MQINVIYMSINVLNIKRKRIEKTLFNVFVLKENDYLNVNITYALKKNDYFYIHITFLNELNNQNHSNLISNDFNILNTINQTNQNEDLINLITNSDLNKNLTFVKFMNFYIRMMLNFDCIHHFFIDHSIFIIYDKIQFRFIKNIKNVKIQFFICDIINLDCNVNDKRVILTIFNVLHVFNMNVNLLSIKKFLNINIKIVFHKKNCVLIQNNITLINIRNRDFFF